jgi:Cu2+-exporting ATPase
VPAAQIVAAGTLMRSGVLIKDGSALERLAEVDHALFDKTGTLTLGRPQPIDLDSLRPVMKPVVLALAQGSRHPLSVALRTALEQEGVTPAPVEQVREEPGFGMRGRYLDAPVSLGRPNTAGADSQMAVAFAMDGLEPCVLRFEDAIRPGAEATLARLDRLGIQGSIASGDRAESVAPVAQALDLAAQTDMRPEDKLAAIDRLAATGAKVLMVGDGLNDGPALAAGHASMAPASASDVGQTAADAVFMGDNLAPIATTILVARRTMRIVRQNFAIAISYNMVAIPLALLGLVTPLVAALAMSGSSVIVVGNALRLRRVPR